MSETVIVTGTAGFIGSTLSRDLVDDGYRVIGSDFLSGDERWQNLDEARISDFVLPEQLPGLIESGAFGDIAAILHQGGCSDTTHRDGPDMMFLNYHHPKELVHAAISRSIPITYASSAAVYGNNRDTAEIEANERPLNLYAYSKLQFDRYVRANIFDRTDAPVVGLRYFNVYGEREVFKGRMASVIHHFRDQLRDSGTVRLFAGSGGFADGEQRRDFVCVDDVIGVNRFFGLERLDQSGIFNVGTGTARTFNDLARLVIEAMGTGSIEYTEFPADLEGRYQHFTQADITALQSTGYTNDCEFVQLEDGVPRVTRWLEETQ